MFRPMLLALIIASLMQPATQAEAPKGSSSTGAEPTGADAHIAAGTAAYGTKNYALSETLFKQAVSDLEAAGETGEKLGRARVSLGNSYFVEHKYPEAEAVFLRGLAIEEKTLPANSAELGTTIESVGDALRAQNKWKEAEGYYIRALAIRDKLPPDDDLGWTYHNLGVTESQLKKTADAEKNFRQALAIRQSKPNDLNLAWTYYGLGDACYALNKLDDAEKYWKLALRIRENAYGASSPELLGLLKNLGSYYFKRGQFPFASSWYQRGWAIAEKGTPSLDTAWLANCLADSLAVQGKVTPAEEMYKKALSIREKLAGPRSELVAQTLDQYSELLRSTPRQGEMKEMQARAAAIRKSPVKK